MPFCQLGMSRTAIIFATRQAGKPLCLRAGRARPRTIHSKPPSPEGWPGPQVETAMCLVACLTMSLMPILANAAQMDAQAPSDPQAYCVNRSADFYPYRGEPCKSGYQLGSGNCRKTDGRMVAVPKEQCAAMAGTVELPFEGGRRPQTPKP